MSKLDQWVEGLEQLVLFEDAESAGGAGELLKRTNTNRTIDSEKQAIGLMALRFHAKSLNSLYTDCHDWDWEIWLADLLEDYQQTMAGERNSRIQFMKTVIEQFKGLQAHRRQGFVNFME